MKKYLLVIFLVSIGFITAHGQLNSEYEFKKFKYKCNNDTNSILLPADYQGPKYFCDEEGSILNFVAPDLSMVSILCAGNTIINCSEIYSKIDTIKNENGGYSIIYFDEIKKIYARKLSTKKCFYMYCNASFERKLQLDKAFAIIEKKE